MGNAVGNAPLADSVNQHVSNGKVSTLFNRNITLCLQDHLKTDNVCTHALRYDLPPVQNTTQLRKAAPENHYLVQYC